MESKTFYGRDFPRKAGRAARRRLALSAAEQENTPPAKRRAVQKKQKLSDRRRTAGPKPATRLVTKKAASAVSFLDTPAAETDDEGERVAELERQLEKERNRAADLVKKMNMERKRVAELRAEVSALKDECQKEGEVSAQLRAALEARERCNTTPERPPPLSPTPTPTTAPLVSPSVSGCSPFSLVSRQHPNIVLRELRPEDYAKLSQFSQGRVDRFGCLLFRSVIADETYQAWCLKTNWDGSRGKWQLPQNIKQFLMTTLQQRFPNLTPVEEKRFICRVNEALRTPRNNINTGI